MALEVAWQANLCIEFVRAVREQEGGRWRRACKAAFRNRSEQCKSRPPGARLVNQINCWGGGRSGGGRGCLVID